MYVLINVRIIQKIIEPNLATFQDGINKYISLYICWLSYWNLLKTIWRFGVFFPLKSGEFGPKFGEKLWIMCLCVCVSGTRARAILGSSDRIAHVGKMGIFFLKFLFVIHVFFAGVFLAPPPYPKRASGRGGAWRTQVSNSFSSHLVPSSQPVFPLSQKAKAVVDIGGLSSHLVPSTLPVKLTGSRLL
jgi:hypothetical protein